jgi:hypothetical protein
VFHKSARTLAGFKLSQISGRLATDDASDSMAISISLDYAPSNLGEGCMAATLTGGCACGAIRYECSGDPALALNCYCRDCQRSGGTAMASLMAMPKAGVKLLKGEARYFDVIGESGKKVSRGFCANCGSGLFTRGESFPDVLGIKAASLDDPNQFRPGMNIYTSSAPAWAPMSDKLKSFAKMAG